MVCDQEIIHTLALSTCSSSSLVAVLLAADSAILLAGVGSDPPCAASLTSTPQLTGSRAPWAWRAPSARRAAVPRDDGRRSCSWRGPAYSSWHCLLQPLKLPRERGDVGVSTSTRSPGAAPVPTSHRRAGQSCGGRCRGTAAWRPSRAQTPPCPGRKGSALVAAWRSRT